MQSLAREVEGAAGIWGIGPEGRVLAHKEAIAPVVYPLPGFCGTDLKSAARVSGRGERGRGAKIVDLSRRGMAECGP
jgi:hypothetical protein